MAGNFKVGAICSRNELLTAIIMKEEDVEPVVVKTGSQVDLSSDYLSPQSMEMSRDIGPQSSQSWFSRTPTPTRGSKDPTVVSTINLPEVTVNGEHLYGAVLTDEMDTTRNKLMAENEPDGEENDETEENIWVAMFAAIDKSDDGILSREELWGFIKSVNCPLMQSMTEEEFERDVYSRCLGEKRGSLHDKFSRDDFIEFMEEYAMRIFFMDADLDGDGIVTFEEIITACAKRGLHIGYSEIGAIKMLFDSDEHNLISPKQMCEKLKKGNFSPSMANMPGGEGCNAQRALGKLNREVFRGKDSKFFINAIKFMERTTSVKRTASKRWKPFINFQREVQGRMAMSSKHNLVKDILPGKFKPKDLVNFRDLPALKPEYVEITGIRWVTSELTSQSGSLFFPESFLGEVPVQFATNELLSYFDVTIAESNDNEISLALRHVIQDFTYSDNYLEDYCNLSKEKGGAGGAGCERHEFAHLDMPMKADNGVFVFIKFVDDEETCVHISGFRIPVRHTLYIPGGVIHTNDYLKGTWRTMLSDAGPPIDHVHLHKGSLQASQQFHFTFK